MAELPELIDPETAEAADITLRAAPQIGKLAIFAVADGIILCSLAIVRAFFGTADGLVGWIPYLGKVITQPIHYVQQKLVNFLGGIEADIDEALGHALHNTAVLLNQLWHTLEDMASLMILFPQYLDQAIYSAAIHPLLQRLRGLIRTVEQEILHLERGAIRQGAHITRVINHNVIVRIRGSEVNIRKIITHEIAPIRTTAHDAEEIAIKTRKALQPLFRAVSQTGFLAMLATIVGQAALDAIRCTELGQAFNKRGCSFWKDLSGLLDVLGALFLFESFCDLWAEAEPLFAFILSPVVGVISTFADGACSHRPSDWETIGDTLYLPTTAEITTSLTVS